MFFHHFKYSIKTLFKNRLLLFWTFAFPIILGTLFQMAFHNIEKSEVLDVIPIAIVKTESSNENSMIIQALNQLSSSADSLFSIRYSSEEQANDLLEKRKISGYLVVADSIKVVVKENGINQTILKHVTEEIVEMKDIMKQMVLHGDFSSIKENIDQELYLKMNQIKEKYHTDLVNISNSNLSYTMIEFYTLIAMTCLYGGILGLYLVNQNVANQSANGKRIAVSPTSKNKIIFSSALAGYMVQLIGISLLFLYTIFVLHIDYGEDFSKILILTLVGCFAGLSMGIVIASVFKTNENTKTGIVIAITMLGCFLSGMMGISMKYTIDKNIPFVNLINPASMITDGFYVLYYYDTFNRYYFDVISLLIFSFVMILLSIHSLRRQKYDSI